MFVGDNGLHFNVSLYIPLQPVLDLPAYKHKALLSVSALVHSFCRNNDCAKNVEALDIVSRLVNNLGNECEGEDNKQV